MGSTGLRLAALACLGMMVASLNSVPSLRAPHTGAQRSRTFFAQLAPEGWISDVDEASGHTFYYHEQTGQSQWESPFSGNAAQFTWVLAPSDTVLDEYIVRSGETQVLGRADMVKPNPYVSREQCLVQVAADGTASVVSMGKAQTYVFTECERPPPGEMIDHTVVLGMHRTVVLRTVVLRTGQTHVLQDRDQIVFRQAKFTVYAMQSGYGQQDAANGWVTGADEARGEMFYNEQTGQQEQHQWEQLAPGWVTGVDEASGQMFYYNEHTGQSQWEPP